MSQIYQHYMEETNTVADLDEKQVEEVETSEPTTETTEQTTEDTQVDPFKEQLEKLETQNRQKDGALKEERRKRKELEAKLEEKTEDTPSKGLTLEEVDKLLEQRLAKEKFEARLDSFSNNENERKLIRFHYENSINRTGDVATDLTMAVALANSHIIQKAKEQEQEQFETEATLARVSKGGVGTRSTGTGQDAMSRATAAFLKNIGEESAVKYIK